MSESNPSPSFRDSPPPPIFFEATEPSLEQIRRDRDKTKGTVRKMLEHLEGVLFEPSLSVQTWKRACDIRDNSVAIQFHKALGFPPRTYIERLRIEVGSRLLRDSNLYTWQIAELLGYSSLGIFSKAFGRCVGIRPRDYRHQAQSGDEPLLISNLELERAFEGDLEEQQAERLIATIFERYPNLDLASIEETSRKSKTEATATQGGVVPGDGEEAFAVERDESSTTNPEATDEPPRESTP